MIFIFFVNPGIIAAPYQGALNVLFDDAKVWGFEKVSQTIHEMVSDNS